MAIVYGLGRNSRSRTCFGGGPGYPCPSLYIENHRAELQTSLRGVMENNFFFLSLPPVSCLVYRFVCCIENLSTCVLQPSPERRCSLDLLDFQSSCIKTPAFSRKEVFQPHLPVRLPCYDLAPITSFALGRSSSVTYFRHPRLSWLDGRCVQGPGTYSPRHG